MSKKIPFLKTAYDFGDEDYGISFEGQESKTQQHFAEEVDINTIVKRFGLTGQLPDVVRVPRYGDFTGITDYHSAMNAVRQAEEGFMELPAELRARFQNDPQLLMEFMEDDANLEEARKLGLVNPAPEVTRDEVVAAPGAEVASVPKAPG